jgi:hypothetical protein
MIPQLPTKVFTSLAAFLSNSWTFYDLNLLTWKKSSTGLEYTVPEFPFGILPKDESDPSKASKFSTIGSYLIRNSSGELTIISSREAQFYVR